MKVIIVKNAAEGGKKAFEIFKLNANATARLSQKIRSTCSCLESVATDTSVLMSQGLLLTARRKRFT